MNTDLVNLFSKLTEDRKDSAKTLEKTSMRGLKDSVVEKYSDQAHFIYELIQNADDVGATYVRFVLHSDNLVFIHNGKRHFNVTDVQCEEKDTENGTLGDINAITSIANSNKTAASIGKFGVGFKAVFQYTNEPRIYDPEISFRIERFIVPVLINDDFTGKKPNETAFVFPFNHPTRTADEAFEDILYKLQHLVFPTLFLNNMKRITYECESKHVSGEYTKTVLESREYDDIYAEKLLMRNGHIGKEEIIWLFSRTTAEKYKYSCGFFLNNAGMLKQTYYPAFCFFPTKKNTNLNFIINAPFLLTDSREGIRAGVSHNKRMIDLLGHLAATCFLILKDIGIESGVHIIDDDILEYIPINRSLYLTNNERDDISLWPIYESVRDIFKKEALWPSYDEYVRASDGYIAFAAIYCDLFSNEQLTQLCNNPCAKWIIPSISLEKYYRAQASDSADIRYSYIVNEMEISGLRDLNLIDKLTAEFMNKQPLEWAFKLYEFLVGTKDRIERCKTKPILFDQNHNATAPYDDYDNLMIFLDDSAIQGYSIIAKELLNNDMAMELIRKLGIRPPELRDKVYNKILQKEELDDSDFKSLLDYYIQLRESDNEDADADWEFRYEILDDIEEICFIECIDLNGETFVASPTADIYFNTEELHMYFKGAEDVLFINDAFYEQYLTKKELNYLTDFLKVLRVSDHVLIKAYELSREEADKKYPMFEDEWERSTRAPYWIDKELDSYRLVLKRISDNEDKELSVLLWNELLNVFENKEDPIRLEYHGFFRLDYTHSYPNGADADLRELDWVFDRNGRLTSPDSLSYRDLDPVYNVSGIGADRLMSFLEITHEFNDYSEYDDDIARKLTEYDKFAQNGIFDHSLEELAKALKLIEQQSEPDVQEKKEKHLEPEIHIIDEIKTRIKEHKDNQTLPIDSAEDIKAVQDSDELIRASVDYSHKMEQMKKSFEEDVAQLAQIEEAHNTAMNSPKYSYGWFRALLLLETLTNGNDYANSREVKINFSMAEPDPTARRTIILKHPDKGIPLVMEQLVDIPMDITFSDDSTKRLIIDAANVQSYTLRVKVKSSESLEGIDYRRIRNINITAKNPSFLTQSLLQEFSKFSGSPYNYADDFNMQMNLCQNISFVFGPPGTGKTTYLARETLIPLIQGLDRARILVLTPTNKAADVLVKKVVDSMRDDHSYEKWLVRYGITSDEEIEESPIFKGKDFEIDDYDKCVIVTTMARFPYDYFIDSTGKFNFIHGINWDYIVVDEASMIPLIYMVYMLYLKTPKKFIVAGDPFQIEPTTSVSEWKEENIYTMVHLNEFSESAATVPHKYNIKLLITQYRSIPSIGNVFSKFSYKGVLKHYRTEEQARQLNIEPYLEYDNLNIIHFPVSQFESIYRAKKLKTSNYQVYSALFTYEFVVYLSKAIAKANENEAFTIGIIAPYSAQAKLVDKLLSYANIPKTISIYSDTIHGFQGDECDIVIALFNPPPYVSTNKEIFLNKQNIINVAISRARDYLFVLVPDENTKNVGDLLLLEKLKSIIRKDYVSEHYAREIEETMFGRENYIEDGAFSTGHQLVNVYGQPEKRYEVRSEETALDVQVHGESEYPGLMAEVRIEKKLPVNDSSIPGCLINCEVDHIKYGEGVIVSCDDERIVISFDGELKTFVFPTCFEGIRLTLVDSNMQRRIEEYLLNR